MNKEEYELALNRVGDLEKELESLSKQIIQYENEFEKPNFLFIREVQEFVAWEGKEGSRFDYEDKTYEVIGVKALEDEFGRESAMDSIFENDSIKGLVERCGVIKEVTIK
jgi:hypothetical protein